MGATMIDAGRSLLPGEVEFANRVDGGGRLASALESLRAADPVIVGIAPGGIVVATEVARAFGAPLDVIVVLKVLAPKRPSLVLATVAPRLALQDAEAAREAGLSARYMGFAIAHAAHEMNRQMERYQGRRCGVPLEGRTVVIVDDVLVTGITIATAVEALRLHQPRRIVVATPAGNAAAVARAETVADEVVTLATPADGHHPRECYHDFAAITDEDVFHILHAAPRARG